MNRQPVALIAGISGQDGSYMAELLAGKGYKVYGITRDPSTSMSKNLRHLEGLATLIYSSYELHQLVEIVHKTNPTEIYNFAGQSYVSKSWEMVEETINSQGVLTARILEAILATNSGIKFINASSSEIFTPIAAGCLTESSHISPYNPYGCSKALGHCMVDVYRNAHGIFAANAILFPHESPRRDPNFVFMKIIKAAVAIKNGSKAKLKLGNLQVFRDWGYAPSFVSAMHKMAYANSPANLCLCTGQARSVQQVVDEVFSQLRMDWHEHVEIDSNLRRTSEPQCIFGDPAKAQTQLDWNAAIPSFEEMVDYVINFEDRMENGQEKDFRNEHPRFN